RPGACLTGCDAPGPDVYADRVPGSWCGDRRREQPVFWHPEQTPNHGFWSVMRYRDLDRVMNDPAMFSSARGGIILEEMEPDALEARRSMMETDPPRHTRLRRIVSPLFTPRAIREYAPFCREMAVGVLARPRRKGALAF